MLLRGMMVLALTSGVMLGPELAHSTANPTPLCEVFKNPTDFNGQPIHVVGVAVEAIHTVAFIDPDCTGGDNFYAAQLNFVHLKPGESRIFDEYWDRLSKDRSIQVEIEGIFFAGDRQYGPGGFPYFIRVSSIVNVARLSKSYKRDHKLPH